MISEGIQKILDISKQVYEREIDGRLWTNRKLERVPLSEESSPITLKFDTLLGISDFANDFESTVETDHGCLFFHVKSPFSVDLCGQLQSGNFNKRFIYATADMNLKAFNFSSDERQIWYDLEMFIISLQSLFIFNNNLECILDNACHVADENIIEHKDDRMAQSLVIRTGIASRGTEKVQNPVTLIPWRTFREVSQPASQFILRWRKASPREAIEGNINVKASLWEADGGIWRLDAMKNIAQWLEDGTELKAIA